MGQQRMRASTRMRAAPGHCIVMTLRFFGCEGTTATNCANGMATPPTVIVAVRVELPVCAW